MNEEQSRKHFYENMKNTKILLYSVIVALIIGITGMSFSIKSMNIELETKSYQINMLMEEVGEVKNNNQYLHKTISQSQDYTWQSFEAMNEIYSMLQNYMEDNFNEKLKINEQKLDSLSKFLNEREQVLKQLNDRNKQLYNEIEFKNNNEDMLNILILGTDGYLTDTIMLATVNEENESVILFSIPRDLYINGRKINSILATYGIDKLKRDIHSVTGVYADKYMIIDLDAFVEAIDIIGGVELYVEKDIHDPYFPTDANGYTTYSVKEGLHNMNSKDAMRYVRSRKTTSDFDRSKRQQQVVQAIRTKLKELNILKDLDKAKDLFVTFVQNVETNIDMFEALYYLKNHQNYTIEAGNVISVDNLLYASKTSYGQYILLPKRSDFYDIKKYVSDLIGG